VVAFRFPADWKDDAATGTAQPPTFALASVSEPGSRDSAMLFNPNPMWPVAAALAAEPAPDSAASREPKAEPKSESKSEPKPEPKPAPKAQARPLVVATRSLAPVRHPSPSRDSGMLFNEAQLTSIKARLRLSDYQEQYWPPVAAALHAIGVRVAQEPVRPASAYAGEGALAGIDPDGPEVQQLKSVAFPLIMSMNYEQKDQVRVLARMMGLEQVASSF
jgi:outer membrane biosynthesis protein TonB